jgi:hypothetical protein
MASIREMVKEVQNEVANGNLEEGRAAELLNTTAALVGNLNDEILKREIDYNKVLLLALDTQEKAGKAKIMAQLTTEYQLLKEATNTKELNTELMRSLKYYLQAKREEWGTLKYQK